MKMINKNEANNKFTELIEEYNKLPYVENANMQLTLMPSGKIWSPVGLSKYCYQPCDCCSKDIYKYVSDLIDKNQELINDKDEDDDIEGAIKANELLNWMLIFDKIK